VKKIIAGKKMLIVKIKNASSTPFVYIKSSEVVVVSDLIESFTKILTNDNFNPSMPVFADHSDLEALIDWTPKGILQLAAISSAGQKSSRVIVMPKNKMSNAMIKLYFAYCQWIRTNESNQKLWFFDNPEDGWDFFEKIVLQNNILMTTSNYTNP
jgi:hypothetical protein